MDWDPLGALGAAPSGGASSAPIEVVAAAPQQARPPFLDWTARKAGILREYTVNGKMAFGASTLLLNDAGVANTEEETESVPLAKARRRLEALEAASRGAHTLEMTQADYEARIEKLSRALSNAWGAGHRVASLKIAIQCAKLLGEDRVPAFYPSAFVLVTDILDSFGSLVFSRLKTVADEEYRKMSGIPQRKGAPEIGLPAGFIAADVGAEARETAKNWMYKVACIRELLPRLYIEMALLPCYRFIFDADFGEILLRLAHAIRGIGNPLVASYARLYLSRMASTLLRDDVNRQRPSLLVCLGDFFTNFKPSATSQARSDADVVATALTAPGRLRDMSARHGLSEAAYLKLFQPSLTWQMHQLAWGAGRDTFLAVLQMYREGCGSGLVLQAILMAFDPAFYCGHLPDILALVHEATASTVTQADILQTLASQLSRSSRAAPPPAQRVTLKDELFAALSSTEDDVGFFRLADAVVGYLAAYFGRAEMARLLQLASQRLRNASNASRAAAGAGAGTAADEEVTAGPSSRHLGAACVPHVEAILKTITKAELDNNASSTAAVSGEQSSSGAAFELITSSAFLSLMDALQGDARVAVAKWLLLTIVPSSAKITDPTLVGVLKDAAKAAHESLDSSTVSEEAKASAATVASLIRKVDFGRDLEQQLGVYVEFRRQFVDLDEVLIALVECAINLSRTALRFVGGNAASHTASTGAFVRAVVAFITITIPSIDDPLSRMRIAISGARAAMDNGCTGQADALFKAAIQELAELSTEGVPPSREEDLAVLATVQECACAAVSMPGHPDQGGFYIARGLLNAATVRYKWSGGDSSLQRALALMAVGGLVSALLRFPLPTLSFDKDSGAPCLSVAAASSSSGAGGMSNADLHAGDVEYKHEGEQLLQTVVTGLRAAVTAITQVSYVAEPGARKSMAAINAFLERPLGS